MRALDLFCGAGGAAMGLSRAGFDVVDEVREQAENEGHDARRVA